MSEIEPLQQFARLFVGRRNDFARQRSNGSYFRVGRPLTLADIRAHLAGEVTLGSYVINEAGRCRYAVFDADLPHGLQALRHLQARLARAGLASYLEASRRGGHLWIFFNEPIPASQVRAWLFPYCPSDIEFYPKQAEGAGYGSLIRLPLGVHLRSGKRYPFVEWTSCGPVAVVHSSTEPLGWLATIQRVPVPVLSVPAPRAPRTTPQQTSFSLSWPLSDSPFPETIRQWCAQQDPYSLIGTFVDIDAKGIGRCPFGKHHSNGQDTRASFKVYEPGEPGGYCWYCYVWGRGGSVFDFLRYWHGLSAQTLWRRLREEACSMPKA